MALKLSHEPAVTATVTAGITTAVAVGAALNAADMPAGWDWMETWVPVGLLLAYLIVGLIIRPLVTPNAKVKELKAAVTELRRSATPSHVRRVNPATLDLEERLTGGYQGGDVAPPD